jgi:NAD-dependent dihydropyrimidine dehydrogenase PreA subunit
MVPWPTEPGLRRIGEPNDLSPVIVTGNYDLTVRRVRRALEGSDAWLLVAPSGGINVWCASAGGHLTTHQVVTALKTSGVAEAVRHRRAVLPQLAATGVLAREVGQRCGWRVHFGPVYARDLPRYLAAGGEKTDDMRRVRFGAAERLQMAAAWGGPMALAVGGAAAFLQPAWSLPLVALAAGLALAVFGLYDHLPDPRAPLFGALALIVACGATWLAGGGGAALVGAAAACVGMTALVTFDYEGNTPTVGASFFEHRRWRITLDEEACRGVYQCWQVCPEACFEKRDDARKVDLAHDERCIRCGACIVQCPMDALAFEDESGTRVDPAVIRRYKLNLLGKRTVDAGGASPTEPAS